jgi:hypothetical protein
VYGGHHPAPARGIGLLQPWVEASRALPEFQAWVLADLAKYAAQGGAFDSAVSLAEQACEAAERADHWLELWLRRCDYGSLLVRAGRAAQALAVIPDPDASVWSGVRVDPSSGPEGSDLAYLSRAEANYALGDLSEAQWALAKAQAQEMLDIPEEQQRAAGLATRLQSY